MGNNKTLKRRFLEKKAKIPGKEGKKFLMPDNAKDILKEILHTYKTFEPTETMEAIKQIMFEFSFEGIKFNRISFGPLTPEKKVELKMAYDEFIEKHNIKDEFFNENIKFFDKLLNIISKFEDNKDPYSYLDFVDSEEFTTYSERNDDRETHLWNVILFNRIYELSKNKMISEKIETYDKWLKKNESLFSELPKELNKYRFAYYLEAVDRLIYAYNFISDKKIKPELCFHSIKLIVVELASTKQLDKFDLLDFFKTYNESIRTKYSGFILGSCRNKKTKELSFEEGNLKFAKEFKYQYLQKIISTYKLI